MGQKGKKKYHQAELGGSLATPAQVLPKAGRVETASRFLSTQSVVFLSELWRSALFHTTALPFSTLFQFL